MGYPHPLAKHGGRQAGPPEFPSKISEQVLHPPPSPFDECCGLRDDIMGVGLSSFIFGFGHAGKFPKEGLGCDFILGEDHERECNNIDDHGT